MSNISTAYDAIKTRMETLFPLASGYKQLVNPYDPEQNPDQMLSLGWGISFGPGSNTERNVGCQLSIERTMSITLVRTRLRGEFAVGRQETNEKLLMEDHFTLVKDLEKEPAINNAVSGIAVFKFTGDGGIETVVGEQDQFIKIVLNFTMEYFENLVP